MSVGKTDSYTVRDVNLPQGSYAGDSPFPGLVHRGVEFSPQLTGRWKSTVKGSDDFVICELDTFADMPIDGEMGKEFELNYRENMKMYAVAKAGASADCTLHVMEEK